MTSTKVVLLAKKEKSTPILLVILRVFLPVLFIVTKDATSVRTKECHFSVKILSSLLYVILGGFVSDIVATNSLSLTIVCSKHRRSANLYAAYSSFRAHSVC